MTLDLDPERRLALAYVPAARRAAVEALWRLDVALADVLATGRDPMISRIRLAWWRESLEKLDREPPPPQPVLEAVSVHLLSAGLPGAALAGLEEGWAVLADAESLDADALETHAVRRGGLLFALSARLLGGDPAAAAGSGEAWALVDLARHSSRQEEAEASLEAARRRGDRRPWPVALRPLGMLAALARGDAEAGLPLAPQASPRRMLRMIGHRLTGR
ncbi:squalene/phytoene synthase family protein [Sphingosinicella terrae]|uniref:squalene/phytoene synthase family protein n=1 Tax=Sphingosinicella terrae TaxID=2172047 RepID=UPI000E0D9D6A|nr:squalene/phytoene synthase family protein [Sphingosinicella terrae]